MFSAYAHPMSRWNVDDEKEGCQQHFDDSLHDRCTSGV